MDETREVKIGGTVDTYFDDNGKLVVNYHDYARFWQFRMICRSPATAPMNIARLRLWKSTEPDRHWT